MKRKAERLVKKKTRLLIEATLGSIRRRTAHKSSFQLSGAIDKINNLPIFKLLQAFKLQQYAKTFTDLGYGFEVYKVALLLPKQRHGLLNKLNLMPGHRARFISLFEIIDQIYPKEEKFKMLKEFRKASKHKPSTTQTNFAPDINKNDNKDAAAKNTTK